ncbi:MAG: DUF998 domain-containing protein [Candidatus Bathyarchaeia archaeon]
MFRLDRGGGWLKVVGVVGLTCPVVGFAAILLAVRLSPWFDWRVNALSDLGVGNASSVFNLGLMACGVLYLAFALGLLSLIKGRVGRVGCWLMFIDGLFLIGVGVFPETFGAVHYYFSVLFFTFIPISLWTMGAWLLTMEGEKPLAFFTILMGVLSAAVWTTPHDGVAIPEATSSLAASVWIWTLSVKVLWEAVR